MRCQIPQISWHGRDPVLSLDFQFYDGKIRRLATGGTDAHVIIWSVALCPKNTIDVECVCDLERHSKSVNVVRFSPNGELLASGDDDGGIFIWRLKEKTHLELDGEETMANKENWAPFKLLRGHLDDICDLNWSPNNERLISGSIDNSVVIWDIQKGLSIHVAKEAKGFVQGVTWDPLNQYFASISSDRMLRIYNCTSGKIVHRIHRTSGSESVNKNLNKFNKLFHDDTLQSFCRRLNFSHDGELLFVPSGIRERNDKLIHTTYVFSRYDFTHPVFHLPTDQKYTVAVRCCPLLFELRENKNANPPTPLVKLPYRILVAVATQDAIYLYDTQQLTPFAYISNIHYAHLTDIAWSSDGHMLVASSTDGYCSVIIFNKDELGEIYVPEPSDCEKSDMVNTESFITDEKEIKMNVNCVKSNEVIQDSDITTSQQSDKPESNRSPRKAKTPKKIKATSAKKSSTKKVCSRDIASFFSPRAKLFKDNPDSDKTTLNYTNVDAVSDGRVIDISNEEMDIDSEYAIDTPLNIENTSKFVKSRDEIPVDIDMEDNVQQKMSVELPTVIKLDEISKKTIPDNEDNKKIEYAMEHNIQNEASSTSTFSQSNILPLVTNVPNEKSEVNSSTSKQKRRIQLITL